ncbi:unnamed protein product [Ranitomeya imitator]|uniref:Cytochrome P450 n=1 Tax=Ranitomeya imitator TaxID=111125 RepID=A0ABN9MC49_9NEOB|nr:unnamed protein product [Ranitomeya imitator]
MPQAVANVICSVVFGNRFEYEDLKFLKLLNQFNEIFVLMSSTWGQLQELIPTIMNYIPGPHQKISPIIEKLIEFVAERVKKNEASIDPNSPRDYIDCFIAKMQQMDLHRWTLQICGRLIRNKYVKYLHIMRTLYRDRTCSHYGVHWQPLPVDDDMNVFFTRSALIESETRGNDNENPTSEFNMRNLLLTVLNLFFAGTETVSSTLRHGFLILIKYPEIQEKLHKEIDTVIGHNRSPNIEDRSKMPYMDAVIHEIQRFSDVIPMNVPHTVIKDTTFRGFSIPKASEEQTAKKMNTYMFFFKILLLYNFDVPIK